MRRWSLQGRGSVGLGVRKDGGGRTDDSGVLLHVGVESADNLIRGCGLALLETLA